QAFETADRWIVVGAANQANWLRLTKAIGADHLAGDPSYKDNPARMTHLEELVADISPIFKTKTSSTWLEILADGNVPAAPILSMDEVAHHPQALARDMFVDITHPELGKVKTLGLPIKLSRTPGRVEGTTSPTLGQHAAEVLREAGWSDADIQAAFENGAFPAKSKPVAAE
ncbi:MAG: CoA transferase, partial [Pseudomonadota bacterium]